MDIKYDEKGRILSCSTVKKVERGKNILKVPEKALPEDFLATFALGKYRVSKGKIVENKNFIPPDEDAEISFLELAPGIPQKPKKKT